MSFFNELKRRNVIRVAVAYLTASWLIVEVASTVFPLYGLGDGAVKILITTLAIGFPLFLLFSWVFEITPEGLKREKDIDRTRSITQKTGKHLDRAIIVLLALALGYFAFDKFVLDPVEDQEIAQTAHEEGRTSAITESYGDKSIAVLPFVNMSADPEQEYFSDGISEELLNLLAQIPEIRVPARTSSFFFKGKDVTIRDIADHLEVAHVLEGSVRKAGNRVRITAQLIEARSDTHLWSDTYDRDLDDIFAVQDEIAAAITEALRERLGIDIKTREHESSTGNSEAYLAFLRGRELLQQRTFDSITGSLRELEEAVKLDPEFALAQAELALALVRASGTDMMILERPEALRRASLHAELALTLDPNLPEAHLAWGWIYGFQGEVENSLSATDRAIDLNPNYSAAHSWKASRLQRLGRYEEQNVHLVKAYQLDPLSKVAVGNYIGFLLEQERQEEAELELGRIREILPDVYAYFEHAMKSVGGRWADEALGLLEALNADPQNVGMRNFLAYRLCVLGLVSDALVATAPENIPYLLPEIGQPQEAISIQEELLAEAERTDTNVLAERRGFGLILAIAGDYARARPFLEEMWEHSEHKRGPHFALFDAAILIIIRRTTGDDEDVDELLGLMRDEVQQSRTAGRGTGMITSIDFDDGLTQYLAGKHEEGLALITKAVRDGYWMSMDIPIFEMLYDEPGFVLIRQIQEARQARESSRFLEVVCGDNPYAEVWQPLEETCDRYRAEAASRDM